MKPTLFSFLALFLLAPISAFSASDGDAKPAAPSKSVPIRSSTVAKKPVMVGDKEVKRGISAAQLKEILGAPIEIKTMQAPQGKAEIWIYQTKTPERTRQVAGGMREVPVFDPYSKDNSLKMVQEPIMRLQRFWTTETHQFLIFNDVFVEHKMETNEENSFAN